MRPLIFQAHARHTLCLRVIASSGIGAVISRAGGSAPSLEAQRIGAASPGQWITASECTEENRDYLATPSCFFWEPLGVGSNIALRILLSTFSKKRTHFREMEKQQQWNTLLSLWLHNTDTQAGREVEFPATVSASGGVALSPFKSQGLCAITDNTIWLQEQLSFDFPFLNLDGWSNVCNSVFGDLFLKFSSYLFL